jgi:hypothetical protein
VRVPENTTAVRIFVSVLGVHSWQTGLLWLSGEGGLKKVGRHARKVDKSGGVIVEGRQKKLTDLIV